MGAKAAGEQPVAVGDVCDVAGPAAGRVDGTGHQPRPHVDVAGGVPDDRGLAGGARGGVDTHHLGAGHCEEAERVGVAQVALGEEREASQVVEVLEVC